MRQYEGVSLGQFPREQQKEVLKIDLFLKDISRAMAPTSEAVDTSPSPALNNQPFLTVNNTTTLSRERKLTVTAPITRTDNGPNSTFVIGFDAAAASALIDHGLLLGLADDDHAQYIHNTPVIDARNVINPAGTLDLGIRINGNFALGANPNANHSGTTGAGSVLNGMWFDDTFMEKSITGDDSSGNLRMSVNIAHDGTQSGAPAEDDFGPVQTTLDGVTWAIAPGAGGLVFYKGTIGGGDKDPFPGFRFRMLDANTGPNAKYLGNFMFGKPDTSGEVLVNNSFPVSNDGNNKHFPRVEIHTPEGFDKAHGLLIHSAVANVGARGSINSDPVPLIIEMAGTATEMLQLHRSTGSVDKSLWVTIANDATNTRAEIVFDGKKLNLDVTGMASYPSSSTTDSGVLIKQKLEFVDQDSTPVANRRLAVVDGLIIATNTVDVQGKHISNQSIQGAGSGGFLSTDNTGTNTGQSYTYTASGAAITLQDNAKLLLGTSANDGEIFYDGTDLNYQSGTSGVARHLFRTGKVTILSSLMFGGTATNNQTAIIDTEATVQSTFRFLQPGSGTLGIDLILTNSTHKIQSDNDFEFNNTGGSFTITVSSGNIILAPAVSVNIADSLKMIWGTGSDSSIEWDGNSFEITCASGDMNLSTTTSGDINLTAAGGDIFLNDTVTMTEAIPLKFTTKNPTITWGTDTSLTSTLKFQDINATDLTSKYQFLTNAGEFLEFAVSASSVSFTSSSGQDLDFVTVSAGDNISFNAATDLTITANLGNILVFADAGDITLRADGGDLNLTSISTITLDTAATIKTSDLTFTIDTGVKGNPSVVMTSSASVVDYQWNNTNTTFSAEVKLSVSSIASSVNKLLASDSFRIEVTSGNLDFLVAGGSLFIFNTGNVQITTDLELDGALNHDGSTVGLYNTVPVTQATGYTTFGNLSTVRTLDANATSDDEIADVLGTLIEDLKLTGIIST